MFVSGLSESGYLSNALLTELIPAPKPILVYMESISRVTKNECLGMFSFRNFDKISLVFFTKRSRLYAIVRLYIMICCMTLIHSLNLFDGQMLFYYLSMY